MLDDIFFFGAIGVILGGRLGYVLFYQPLYYFTHMDAIFAFWEGGMSFHGGLIGIILSSFLFSKKNDISFWSLTDLIACISPIGIFFGRIANFINAELVGKVSNLPWSFIFPQYDQLPRHPSQIYEALLEGLLLFIIINLLIRKTNIPTRYLSILFLILYSTFRVIGEIFREPDQQLGYLFFGISMGSILSIITIMIASIFVFFFNKK
jgi:phosphatidylglycerol:prolipoprotein diacylglycerol transferase